MAKVIGYRFFDFTSKKTGKTYPACSLYLTEDLLHGVGLMAYDVFLPSDRLGDYKPALGDDVRILYNRFGGVDSVVKADF